MRRATAGLCLLLALAPAARAQLRPAGDAGKVRTRSDGARIAFDAVALDVSLVAADVVRIRVAPPAELDAEPHSYSVLPNRPAAPPAEVREAREGDARVVTVKGPEVTARVRLDARGPRVTVLDAGGEVVVDDDPTDPLAWDAGTGEVRVSKARPRDQVVYGFGEKALPLERQSYQIVNWNTDTPGYRTGTEPIYQTVPYYIALRRGKAYGLFFDNTYRSYFDVAMRDPDRLTFGAAGGWADYYVFTGGRARDARAVISRYTELTGRSDLPPLWALGYQQCRWSYTPESRVREVAGTFRRLRVPCDAIYLDIDYMEGYRVFTWSRERFPNHEKLVSDLLADGMHTVVIIDPGVKVDDAYAVYRSGRERGAFVRTPDGKEFHGNVWPGVCAFPDFTSPEARAWWGDQFRDLTRIGVAGFWTDMNEPSTFMPDDLDEPRVQHHPFKTFPLDTPHAGDGRPGPHARYHNVYGQQMARATRDGVLALAPDRRPFVLTRDTYAGGQRYSASWTGDNVATWEHLQLSTPMLLNMGLGGQALVGADIGGFIGAPSPELYARWLQAAALTPVMRSHTVKDSPDQEPFAYGPKFTAINRATIELRYRLLPYLYGLFEECERTGVPAMRPLWLDFASDRETYLVDDEYLVGSDLLVAPVVDPGVVKRSVYFPAGATWVDWYTGKTYEGGKRTDVAAPLERLPVFVRAGAVVPMRPVAQYTGAQLDLPVTLRVFPGAAGAGRLYEDAGDGFGYRRGERSETRVALALRRDGSYEVSLAPREGGFRSKASTVGVEVAAARPVTNVTVDGKPARVVPRRDASGLPVVVVALPNDGAAHTVTFSAR
jgi:alpha-glucosidase